ncbi:hypothetical protein [uncultured Campylobacter sp.]|mgnify:FL=1|uniref:hypothetical protein n=1 Tax=uncultured Campylobacter sp. TaxID=218934 RepID=UPI0026347D73|nr:hypothetical protein [uncultured Campylobacter sp.]
MYEISARRSAKYDKTSLINSSEAHEFLFFYKPDAAADESCLGQWQSSPFAVDADEYLCAEQFMMASKARILILIKKSYYKLVNL